MFRIPKVTTKQINEQKFIQIRIEKLKDKEIFNIEFIKTISLKNQPITL